MHKTIQESVAFVKDLIASSRWNHITIGIAPPATALASLRPLIDGTHLLLGAQNAAATQAGAYTGELSAVMVEEAGANFCFIGHSERRHLFGETNEVIQQKLHRVLETRMTALLCVGETLLDRQAERTEEVIKEQLHSALANMPSSGWDRLWIAYEPVWAIGTGHTANASQIIEAHHIVRRELHTLSAGCSSPPILYGGSVRPESAGEMVQLEDVDGLLVGGASLELPSWVQIIERTVR